MKSTTSISNHALEILRRKENDLHALCAGLLDLFGGGPLDPTLPVAERYLKLVRDKMGAGEPDDPNYRAFRSERDELLKAHGACVVAYAGGRRVALARSLAEVWEAIPGEHKGGTVLIQQLPERIIRI